MFLLETESLDCMSNLFESGFAVNGGRERKTPMHKAANGQWMLMCDAKDTFDICNNAGQTAEDIAWSCGFDECGRFLNMHRRTRDLKNTSLSSLSERHTLSSTLAGQKRGCAGSSAQDGKKARDW
ncbi:hypothetical protein cypCar_00033619 [Cyprinus carpio]|nr:hypothetical protein cypCar_00033619 [Cyprinus carpio]